MRSEPNCLRQGKLFHARVQRDWAEHAGGSVHIEHGIALIPSGPRRRRGRLDIFVNDLEDEIAVVEIKATNWNRIENANVQRNLASHRRQIWRYIEKYLDVDGTACVAGIIYPEAPRSSALRQRIEGYFGDYGVTVVWFNETESAA